MTSTNPGELEQLVLFAILRLEDGAYGVAIRELILERTGRAVSPGGLYTVLRRLEGRGLVTSRPAESTSARGGRPRVYYRLVSDGAAVLRRSWDALHTMAEGMLKTLDRLAEPS